MLLSPTWQVEHLALLPVATLHQAGIKAVLLDLDNTLILPKSGQTPIYIMEWMESAKAQGIKLAVITNNKRQHYLTLAEQKFNIPVYGDCHKPSAQYLLSALNEFGIIPEQAVMVGDRPLTDILSGQNAGCKTCWTLPLSKAEDPFIIKCLRFLESLFIKGNQLS